MLIQQIQFRATALTCSPADGCIAYLRYSRDMHDSDNEANVIRLVLGCIWQETINAHIMSLICCQ